MRSLSDQFDGGGLALGMTLTSPDLYFAELYAAAPLDFVVVDCEHAPNTIAQVQDVLIALQRAPFACLVRSPSLDHGLIGALLDVGADGIVAPHIDRVDDARRVPSRRSTIRRRERGGSARAGRPGWRPRGPSTCARPMNGSACC